MSERERENLYSLHWGQQIDLRTAAVFYVDRIPSQPLLLLYSSSATISLITGHTGSPLPESACLSCAAKHTLACRKLVDSLITVMIAGAHPVGVARELLVAILPRVSLLKQGQCLSREPLRMA